MTRCRSVRLHERMAHGHEAGPYILTRPIGRLGINVDFFGQGLATVCRELCLRKAGRALSRPGTGTKKKDASSDMLVPPHRSGNSAHDSSASILL